jgi:hypothetical protein
MEKVYAPAQLHTFVFLAKEEAILSRASSPSPLSRSLSAGRTIKVYDENTKPHLHSIGFARACLAIGYYSGIVTTQA